MEIRPCLAYKERFKPHLYRIKVSKEADNLERLLKENNVDYDVAYYLTDDSLIKRHPNWETPELRTSIGCFEGEGGIKEFLSNIKSPKGDKTYYDPIEEMRWADDKESIIRNAETIAEHIGDK